MNINNTETVCGKTSIHETTAKGAITPLLADTVAHNLADTFKILGDPTRIKILSLLTTTEMRVCDIADTLQMGQSAISHQLRILRGARLVKFRKDGKEAWYSLDDNHVVTLMNQGLEHINHQ